MIRTIDAKPTTTWPKRVERLWALHVAPRIEDWETCESANYFTLRPYRNEYDRGSNREGFVYVMQPGDRVCTWQQTINRGRTRP
jgi:hypothetical protein